MEPQEKILKTSLGLFVKYGIKHVTMDDIAKELGMSKKTIYQFYKEKDELVNQLCEIEMQEKEEEFNGYSRDAKDPIHEIILISENMRRMMQNINPVFFMDMQKFYPAAFKRFQNFKENCAYQNVLSNIRNGIVMGVYRDEIDPEFAAKYRMAQVDMLMFGNYFSYDKMSFLKTHELIMEMFVYGLCTSKGHKLLSQYKEQQVES